MALLAHTKIRWWLWRSLLASGLLLAGFWLGPASAGGPKATRVNTGLAVNIALAPPPIASPEVKTVVAAKPARKKPYLPKPEIKAIKQNRLAAKTEMTDKRSKQHTSNIAAVAATATERQGGTVNVPETLPDDAYVHISQPVFANTPIPPRYPTVARKRGQQGTVWLDVWLDKYGQQQKLAIATSSGLNSLDNSAFKAVSSWRFKAHLVNGIAMATRVRIPVQFSLN